MALTGPCQPRQHCLSAWGAPHKRRSGQGRPGPPHGVRALAHDTTWRQRPGAGDHPQCAHSRARKGHGAASDGTHSAPEKTLLPRFCGVEGCGRQEGTEAGSELRVGQEPARPEGVSAHVCAHTRAIPCGGHLDSGDWDTSGAPPARPLFSTHPGDERSPSTRLSPRSALHSHLLSTKLASLHLPYRVRKDYGSIIGPVFQTAPQTQGLKEGVASPHSLDFCFAQSSSGQ